MLALNSLVPHIAILFSFASLSCAFPNFSSSAGLSERQGIPDGYGHISAMAVTGDQSKFKTVYPPKPPGPLKYSGTKLVYDKAHPFKAPGKGDVRGPCPGLNTLANHGYLPRNGVATPSQIINAAQEGFNMRNIDARFVTYTAHLVAGNLLTDLVSIGGKTSLTGPDPAGPAPVAGMSTTKVFEGDTSMTRADSYFGDNSSFNQTLFNQFVEFSNRYGAGFYNMTVAQELRHALFQQSIATNPEFSFVSPRFFTAFAESTFPLNFMVDGRNPVRALSMPNSTLFFKDNKFPTDFYRAKEPVASDGIDEVFAAYPVAAGRNMNGVNTYEKDPKSGDFEHFCLSYTNFVEETVKGMYPNPTGLLRRNLIVNMEYLYDAILPEEQATCPQLYPYGRL